MAAYQEELNTNLAYDYSRFERKVAPEKPNLTVIRTDRQERQTSERQRMALLRTISMLMVCAVVAAVFLLSKVQVTELTQKISGVKAELGVAQSENVRLSLALESQLSLDNIEEYATNLGLSKVQQYQVTCISLDEEDVVTISEHQEGFFEGVVNGIGGLFEGLLAYLGW